MKYRFFALTLVHAISTLLAASVEKYEVETEYQNGKQEIRVLLPDNYKMTRSYQVLYVFCLLYTSPSPRDVEESRMPSSA